MKNEEYVEFPLKLKKETLEKIKDYIDYLNIRNKVKKTKHKDTVLEINDFITGCTNTYIYNIENMKKIAGYDDLGKPHRLRNNFKEIAKIKGLKQKELAEITNIDPSNISIIFSNRSQPSLDYFLRIWIALDYPPLHKVFYRKDD